MKTNVTTGLVSAVLLATLIPQFSTAFAQGSLTPPGAPAPGMRTLLQIEPRTPISSLPFVITNAGSYFLTTNLTGGSGTNGITIFTNNVTIDLRGFTLTGVPGALDGIHVAGTLGNLLLNIVVKEGTISGWPGNGIDADTSLDSQFSDLNLSGNSTDGLNPGGEAVVRHCVAGNNSLEGFGGVLDNHCIFEDCIAHDSNDSGFYTYAYCSFHNCTASYNGNIGFNPANTCTFVNCIADDNGTGFGAQYNGCVFTHCAAGNNFEIGILTGDDCTVRDSNASDNGGDGIATGSGCVIESCTASANSSGGINASNNCTINGCVAETNQLDNVSTARGCTLNHCTADASASGNGFTLGPGNTITAGTAFGNAVNGIDAGDRTTAQSCTANFNGNAGIHVTYLGSVQQCSCFNNGVFGILSDANGYASIIQNNCSFNGLLTPGGSPSQGAGIFITNSPGCRVEGNTLNLNYAALVAAANCHSFILRNSAQGSFSTNYALGSGNSWGPIVDVRAGGDISGVANSSHPDANFIH